MSLGPCDSAFGAFYLQIILLNYGLDNLSNLGLPSFTTINFSDQSLYHLKRNDSCLRLLPFTIRVNSIQNGGAKYLHFEVG